MAPAPVVQATVAGTRDLWSKLAWPFLLACGLLVVVSASSIYLVISSQSSRDATNRALQLENRLWETMAIVRIAESEQRGYLLTGDPGYLEIYRNTIDASVAALADVRSAAAGSPVQRRAVAEIEPLILRKFDELRETMRLYDSGDHAAALALVRTGLGLDLMTRIRVATLRSMDEQQRLVSLRTSNSASTNIWLLSVNLLGFALIIVLAVISVLVIRRAVEKELAQSESRSDELRATADQRHKAEQKFKEMLEAAPDAMVVVNHRGEIILLNLQAEKQFGYRRDELLGQQVTNIIPDGFAERLLADGLRSPADALAQQIGTGIELVGRRKDGGEFPIEIMLSPLESAEGILVTAAIRDISVRKSSEEHLAQMEARYRGLLEAAPDAMVVVNQRGEIVLLNLQAEKQFGYHRDELLGQKVKNIIPEGFAERLLSDATRTVAEALAQQIGTGIELSGRRKDGTKFPIEIMLSPLESPDGILVTAAVRDISVRRAAEELLVKTVGDLKRSNEELQQFAYVASHDLQEPLRMVASYTQLLEKRYKGQLDSDANEFIAFAVDGCNRMKGLIEDLLAYSRAGMSDQLPCRISGENALGEALTNLRAAVEESGAVVTHDALPTVTTNSTQLTQIFQNLVGNAIKYRGAEPPDIHVSAIRNGGNEWTFSIRDNGMGIDPQYFERIFVIFQRLHGREEFEGTGIGLAVCKKIVEQIGGRIWVESQIKKGSTFYFTLPERDGK